MQSVDRAVGILKLLAAHGEGLTLAAVAAETRLLPQTAQSLLRTLEVHELVVQGGRGRPYRLGPGLLTLARKWMAGGAAVAAAAPVEELAARIHEYVVLAELKGRSVVPLVERQVDQPLMTRPVVAGPDRVHVTATGKVLLAGLDEPLRGQLVSQLSLARHGPRSITDRARLLRHLDGVAGKGFAVCLEEASPHVAAMAVPVRDAGGSVRAALGIWLPLVRFSPPRRRQLLNELRRTAR
ncbi:MAG TPA: hypothetical protein DCX07_04045, partial [Phycisphaerales bacterium]|nr:hypothetical protein [Phycisphaerales bacterium]